MVDKTVTDHFIADSITKRYQQIYLNLCLFGEETTLIDHEGQKDDWANEGADEHGNVQPVWAAVHHLRWEINLPRGHLCACRLVLQGLPARE